MERFFAMLAWDEERFQANLRQATIEDLLDRVTVFRTNLEPQAISGIERELRQRGVSRQDQDKWAVLSAEWDYVCDAEGRVCACSFCRRPAVESRPSWHRLLGKIPIFRRRFYYCKDHKPN